MRLLKASLLLSVALLLLPLPCYSESVSDAEIVAALTEIIAGLDQSEAQQQAISSELRTLSTELQTAQSALSSIATGRLPAIDAQVMQLAAYVTGLEGRLERRTWLLLGACLAVGVLAVVGLVM